jgi:hypothetical protein
MSKGFYGADSTRSLDDLRAKFGWTELLEEEEEMLRFIPSCSSYINQDGEYVEEPEWLAENDDGQIITVYPYAFCEFSPFDTYEDGEPVLQTQDGDIIHRDNVIWENGDVLVAASVF